MGPLHGSCHGAQPQGSDPSTVLEDVLLPGSLLEVLRLRLPFPFPFAAPAGAAAAGGSFPLAPPVTGCRAAAGRRRAARPAPRFPRPVRCCQPAPAPPGISPCLRPAEPAREGIYFEQQKHTRRTRLFLRACTPSRAKYKYSLQTASSSLKCFHKASGHLPCTL